ncbi:alpha/beta fold hydrolase [Patulibacter sp. NPDC049589]|uniref:alpha/beta fold hydrolase n=1 Tax=Patulibacter sp. NPDC049589 TaxID=3154731 RepID=UPI00342E9C82
MSDPSTVPLLTPEEIAETRANLEAFADRVVHAPGTEVEDATIGGRPGLRVTPASGGTRGTGLFLHGGGYRAGGPRGAVGVGSHLAAEADLQLLLPAYRLAPEHPFPAAVYDVVAALAQLAEQEEDPARRVLVGESAGGGLAVAGLLAARAAGISPPGALVLLSPWLDLTAASESYERCAETDEIISRPTSLRSAAAYLDGGDPRDPLASPLFASDEALAALPRTLVQVGEAEVLIDEGVEFARRASEAGGTTLLETWAGVGHCWHVAVPDGGPADAAIARIGIYLES